MNNYHLTSADRLTHIKIVVVSLIAGIVVVGVGKAALPELPDMDTRTVRSPVLTGNKPVVWTQADRVTIR
jgi:hypothetical protein